MYYHKSSLSSKVEMLAEVMFAAILSSSLESNNFFLEVSLTGILVLVLLPNKVESFRLFLDESLALFGVNMAVDNWLFLLEAFPEHNNT